MGPACHQSARSSRRLTRLLRRDRHPSMRARSLLLFVSMSALLACEETPAPVAPPSPSEPPPLTATLEPSPKLEKTPPRADPGLLPRKILFGNPDRLPPHLSPDGKRILF